MFDFQKSPDTTDLESGPHTRIKSLRQDGNNINRKQLSDGNKTSDKNKGKTDKKVTKQ